MSDQPLTHLDDDGHPHMVDTSHKGHTVREAVVRGHIQMSEAAFSALVQGDGPKGEVIRIAEVAGISAAKQTAGLIPLCHPIPIDHVSVRVSPHEGGVEVVSTVRTTWKTGVEMEAMVATTTALLTVYDMLKAVDKGMVLGPVRLIRKTGGKSGTFQSD